MPAAEDHSQVACTERWALMEWILIRRRVAVALILLLVVALAAGGAILEDAGISHLNASERRTFVHRQTLYRQNSMGAPLLERVPPEH